MERKKKRSRLGDLNRDIEGRNRNISALQKEAASLDKAIKKEREPKTPREQHYSLARQQQAAFRKPKIAKAVYWICTKAGFENLRKRIQEFQSVEPPQPPLDPTPGGSHSAKIRKERGAWIER